MQQDIKKSLDMLYLALPQHAKSKIVVTDQSKYDKIFNQIYAYLQKQQVIQQKPNVGQVTQKPEVTTDQDVLKHVFQLTNTGTVDDLTKFIEKMLQQEQTKNSENNQVDIVPKNTRQLQNELQAINTDLISVKNLIQNDFQNLFQTPNIQIAPTDLVSVSKLIDLFNESQTLKTGETDYNQNLKKMDESYKDQLSSQQKTIDILYSQIQDMKEMIQEDNNMISSATFTQQIEGETDLNEKVHKLQQLVATKNDRIQKFNQEKAELIQNINSLNNKIKQQNQQQIKQPNKILSQSVNETVIQLNNQNKSDKKLINKAVTKIVENYQIKYEEQLKLNSSLNNQLKQIKDQILVNQYASQKCTKLEKFVNDQNNRLEQLTQNNGCLAKQVSELQQLLNAEQSQKSLQLQADDELLKQQVEQIELLQLEVETLSYEKDKMIQLIDQQKQALEGLEKQKDLLETEKYELNNNLLNQECEQQNKEIDMQQQQVQEKPVSVENKKCKVKKNLIRKQKALLLFISLLTVISYVIFFIMFSKNKNQIKSVQLQYTQQIKQQQGSVDVCMQKLNKLQVENQQNQKEKLFLQQQYEQCQIDIQTQNLKQIKDEEEKIKQLQQEQAINKQNAQNETKKYFKPKK